MISNIPPSNKTTSTSTPSASPGFPLFIGNLPNTIQESDLQPLFEKHGKLRELRLVMDPSTNHCRGYGFAEFEKQQDANDAVNALNGSEFKGKNIRVEWSKGKQSKGKEHGGDEEEKRNSLFIGNLPRNAEESDLKKILLKYGNITEFHLVRDPYTKECRGYGFVEFETEDDAAEAAMELDEVEFQGRAMRVEFSTHEEKGHHEKKKVESNTLFVGNLQKNVEVSELASHFEEFGVIRETRIVRDPKTNECKGYGFITFQRVRDALDACHYTNGGEFQDRKLRVEFPEEPKEKTNDRRGNSGPFTLYVGNIKKGVKAIEIRQLFEKYGKVNEVRLVKESFQGDAVAGFGFVEFESRRSGASALSLDGKDYHGRKLKVERSKENKKEKKRSRSRSPQLVRPRVSGTLVYCGGLPQNADEQVLNKLFTKYGKLNDAYIVRDALNNESRGFGFVKFEVESEAEKAVSELHGSLYEGKKLTVEKSKSSEKKTHKKSRSRSPPQRSGPKTLLFVGNLNRDLQDDDLRKLFSTVGKIAEFRVNRDSSNGECKGFGFIGFSTEKEAAEAVKTFNGADFQGRQLKVQISEKK